MEVESCTAQSVLTLDGTGPLGLRSDWAGVSKVLLPQNWLEIHAVSSTETTSEPKKNSGLAYWREWKSFSRDKLEKLQPGQENKGGKSISVKILKKFDMCFLVPYSIWNSRTLVAWSVCPSVRMSVPPQCRHLVDTLSTPSRHLSLSLCRCRHLGVDTELAPS